jgi:hypothetical protein
MREHEARSRTCGDRLGVTDTPVCERFHGQRLWSPYIGSRVTWLEYEIECLIRNENIPDGDFRLD